MMMIPMAAPPGTAEVLRALGVPDGAARLAGLPEQALRRAAALAVPRAAVGGPGRRVQAAVVSLGPALEEEVRRLIAAGKTAEGLCLDAAGSAWLAEAVREVARRLKGVWLAPGCQARPLSLVPRIAAAAGSATIGVEVLPSGMLRPEKSVAGWVVRGRGRRPRACAVCASPVCPWSGRR
jgi:hypothetical protein